MNEEGDVTEVNKRGGFSVTGRPGKRRAEKWQMNLVTRMLM